MNDKPQVKPDTNWTRYEWKPRMMSHSGDCSIYSIAQICDCGYLRSAVFQPEPIAPEIHEAWAKHCHALDSAASIQSQLTQAHKERDEAVAACAVMRDALSRWSEVASEDSNHQAFHALKSTNCGRAFLDRMKEAEWLLSGAIAPADWDPDCDPDWYNRRDAFLNGGAK